MPGKKRITDQQVLAAQDIWNAAEDKFRADIERLKREIGATAEIHEAMGAIKKMKADRELDRIIESMLLWKLHKNGRYKDLGLTWSEVCEKLDVRERSGYKILEDVQAVYDAFSANFAELLGLKFNEIKMLGRSISAKMAEIEEGSIVYKDQKVPLSDKEAVQSVLDDLREEMKKLQEEKKKKEEELEVERRAHERNLEAKEEVIKRQESHMKRIEMVAEEKGLDPEEYAFLQKMESLRLQFDSWYMQNLDPERMLEFLGEEKETVRMRAAYLTTLDYIKKQILAAWDTADAMYCDAAMNPELAWEPGEA